MLSKPILTLEDAKRIASAAEAEAQTNGWQVVIYAASPDGILPDLDLQQLNDIELKISTTYATRSTNSIPSPSQCVRVDF